MDVILDAPLGLFERQDDVLQLGVGLDDHTAAGTEVGIDTVVVVDAVVRLAGLLVVVIGLEM